MIISTKTSSFPFTMLSNLIYDRIIICDFTKRERAVLDLIVRTSYGCDKYYGERKNKLKISEEVYYERYSFMQKKDLASAGISNVVANKTLKSLENMNIISIDKWNKYLVIKINKNIEEWSVRENGNKNSLGKLIGINLSERLVTRYQNDKYKLNVSLSQKHEKHLILANNTLPKEKSKKIIKENYKHNSTINKGFQSTSELTKEIISRKDSNIVGMEKLKKARDSHNKCANNEI